MHTESTPRFRAARAVLAVTLLICLLTGCEEKPDKVFTSDGQVVSGSILELSQGGLMMEDSVLLTVPSGPARVLLRNGATYYGSVLISDEVLHVSCSLGDLSFQLDLVSVISWADHTTTHTVMDVPASVGWLNSHIAVSEGDLITLSAGGNASLLNRTTGPAGSKELSGATAMTPEATEGRLLVRIGEAGPEYSAGESWQAESPAEGEIFLAVNSPLSGSEGSYTVSLTVSRLDQDGAGPFAIYPANR